MNDTTNHAQRWRDAMLADYADTPFGTILLGTTPDAREETLGEMVGANERANSLAAQVREEGLSPDALRDSVSVLSDFD